MSIPFATYQFPRPPQPAIPGTAAVPSRRGKTGEVAVPHPPSVPLIIVGLLPVVPVSGSSLAATVWLWYDCGCQNWLAVRGDLSRFTIVKPGLRAEAREGPRGRHRVISTTAATGSSLLSLAHQRHSIRPICEGVRAAAGLFFSGGHGAGRAVPLGVPLPAPPRMRPSCSPAAVCCRCRPLVGGGGDDDPPPGAGACHLPIPPLLSPPGTQENTGRSDTLNAALMDERAPRRVSRTAVARGAVPSPMARH